MRILKCMSTAVRQTGETKKDFPVFIHVLQNTEVVYDKAGGRIKSQK